MLDQVFSRPKSVIQLFHNVHFYGKEQHTHQYRQQCLFWPDSLASRAGFVAQDTVMLNESVHDQRLLFESCDVLVITDYKPGSNVWQQHLAKKYQQKAYTFLPDVAYPKRLELFKLQRDADQFALSLDYSGNSFLIGVPHRDDFKLRDLQLQQPVRVTLNGKTDSSMASGRARSYKIFDYLFVYLGNFTRFKILPWNKITTAKAVPLGTAKTIDLQKVLY